MTKTTLDQLHLSLLREAVPQQYDSIGVMTPGIHGRIGCRASVYRAQARRLSRAGASAVEPLLIEFLADARRRRSEGRPYVQELMWTVMLAASQVPGVSFERRLAWLSELADSVDNWATCDLLGEAVKDFAEPAHTEAARVFLEDLIASRSPWRIRLALVLLLTHFAPAGGEMLRTAFDLAERPEVREAAARDYYVSMGLAWTYSVYAVHDMAETSRRLCSLARSGGLDPATLRRSVQKVRESFRVSREAHAELKAKVRDAVEGNSSECTQKADNSKPKTGVPALRRRQGSRTSA